MNRTAIKFVMGVGTLQHLKPLWELWVRSLILRTRQLASLFLPEFAPDGGLLAGWQAG
jgi:hypothetical protein